MAPSNNYYDLKMVSEVFEEVTKINNGVYIVGSNFQWASENYGYYDTGLIYNNIAAGTENIKDVLVRAAKANGLNIDTSDTNNVKFVVYP